MAALIESPRMSMQRPWREWPRTGLVSLTCAQDTDSMARVRDVT